MDNETKEKLTKESIRKLKDEDTADLIIKYNPSEIFKVCSVCGKENYTNMIWWQLDDAGLPKDPYQLLPPLFEDIDASNDELFLESDTISEGGLRW